MLVSLQAWGWWALARQGIYFFDVDGPQPKAKVRLKFFDLEAKRIRELAKLEKPITPVHPVMTLSPDGRSLVYQQTDEEGSDIMLMENFR